MCVCIIVVCTIGCLSWRVIIVLCITVVHYSLYHVCYVVLCFSIVCIACVYDYKCSTVASMVVLPQQLITVVELQLFNIACVLHLFYVVWCLLWLIALQFDSMVVLLQMLQLLLLQLFGMVLCYSWFIVVVQYIWFHNAVRYMLCYVSLLYWFIVRFTVQCLLQFCLIQWFVIFFCHRFARHCFYQSVCCYSLCLILFYYSWVITQVYYIVFGWYLSVVLHVLLQLCVSTCLYHSS